MPKLKRPYVTLLMISPEWKLPVSFVTFLCKSGRLASVHVQGDPLKVKAYLRGEKKNKRACCRSSRLSQDVRNALETFINTHKHTGVKKKKKTALTHRCRFSRAWLKGQAYLMNGEHF